MRTAEMIDNSGFKQIQHILPADKKFYVWLSHDVDWVSKDIIHSIYYFLKQKRLYHLIELLRPEKRYLNFKKIMELEAQYGAKSTFFFLHETMRASLLSMDSWFKARGRYSFRDKAIQDEIKHISVSGWEVGLHGSYRSYKDAKLLKFEKNLLEQVLGEEVVGIRQHYLNLNIPSTWKIHRELGLKYDSSFGLKRSVGFKDDVCYPFMPFADSSFLVFPLVLMEGYLEIASKGNMAKAKKIIDDLILSCIEKKTIFSVLWHNRSIDEKEFPDLYMLYEYLLSKTKEMGGEFILPAEILKQIG